MSKTEERRTLPTAVELRQAEDDGPRFLEGLAAPFSKLSENLGRFREKIAPGAFADAIQGDVRALFNHNPDHILGRTTAGTLELWEEDDGLRYRVQLPENGVAPALREAIGRGDISGNSFGMIVEEEEFDTEDDGTVVRTVTKVGELVDVGPVTFPAYADTVVSSRSLELADEAAHPEPVARTLRERVLTHRQRGF